MAPMLSVLMPAYGTHEYFDESVASVLNNKAIDSIELIIQNGGKPFVPPPVHPAICLREEPDLGQADALNKACVVAKGEYVGWLNSDDVYRPGVLDVVLEVAHERNPDIIFGSYDLIDADGGILRHCTPRPWSHDRIYRRGCYMFSGATFVRRSLWESIGGLDPSYHYCMDLDFFLRIPPDVTTERLPNTLGALRIHKDSKTGSTPSRFIPEAFRARRSIRPGLAGLPMATWIAAGQVIMTMTQGLRYSRTYSRFRTNRTLG